ncbi:hypothetical protein KFE98_19780 [bacterium SCSIO 12741]|nr:hypothetical protein KFE98_19780 [bacterium SCSIO 12741]
MKEEDESIEFNWGELRRQRFIYRWKYIHERFSWFPPCCPDPNNHKNSNNDQNLNNCIEIQLYQAPENPPFDEYIKRSNWQLQLLVKHFKEVFDERSFIEGFIPEHKYQSVIMPPEIYQEISELIEKFGLNEIHDLILEILAIGQNTYTKNIAFWERAENQKLISSAKSESEKVIKIIEQSNAVFKDFDKRENEISPELDHIKFVFNTGTIKLEHKWLAEEFVEATKEHFDNSAYKNWRLELGRYHQRFNVFAEKATFKYGLTIALYNFLTQEGFIQVSDENPYPNQLMLCIAKLLEFCLLPVWDYSEVDDIKIKHVRNWVKRKELPHFNTHEEVNANRPLLLKYFEQDFIELTGPVKQIGTIVFSEFLIKRFGINDEILPEIVHLIDCLNKSRTLVETQPTFGFKDGKRAPEQYESFQSLISGLNNGEKIASFKFTTENGHERELTERLPLYILEQAIKRYYQTDKVEFSSDVLPTKFSRQEDGAIKIEREDRFSLPNERHLVKLVSGFYNYLKDHAGLSQSVYKPEEELYKIIAVIFIDSWVFYHRLYDEKKALDKIRQWHNLTADS